MDFKLLKKYQQKFVDKPWVEIFDYIRYDKKIENRLLQLEKKVEKQERFIKKLESFILSYIERD